MSDTTNCIHNSGWRQWHARIVAGMAVLLLSMLATSREWGRPADQPSPDEYRISVQVGLVVLPVVVTDRKGKAVSGLDKGDFEVFDDGRPQTISLFEPEDVPVTVGLVVDNSGSMRPKRAEVLAAAQAFARSSNPEDQMFVVNFSDDVSMGLPGRVPFTSNVQLLNDALTEVPAVGNTALYDGVAAALRHARTGTASRKALIVVSDGGDNASRIAFPDLLKQAEAADIQIYTLGVYDNVFAGESRDVLRQLAKATGGKAYFPQSPAQMSDICRQIAQALREQYTLGYHPSNPQERSSYHTVRVTATANRGKLRVMTRSGYRVSGEAG